MYKNKSVCVLLPTYNEKDSIKKCIEDFYTTGFVDRVIVINNNAAKGTSEEVAKTKALEVFESVQGVGAAVMRGLQEASEDLVVICEPDSTFEVSDIEKLLVFSKDYDSVWSSRTYTEMIEEGANMGYWLIWGNVLVAKMFQVLFNAPRLSDMGSTYRLLSKKVVEILINKMTMKGNYFDINLMFLIKINKLKFIEIPVHYKKRVGTSSATGYFHKTVYIGVVMIISILIYRFISLFPFWKKRYLCAPER